jgi:hypothetical protein
VGYGACRRVTKRRFPFQNRVIPVRGASGRGHGINRSVTGHARCYPPRRTEHPLHGRYLPHPVDGPMGVVQRAPTNKRAIGGNDEEGPVVTGLSQQRRALLGIITGVACVVALLAGCSSSSSKTTTSTSAGSLTPSSSSLTSAAPSGSPPSESQLAEIVLQPSDLPPDWTPTPYEAEPGEVAANAAFLKCLGLASSASDKVAEAYSFTFTSPDAKATSSVASSAASYRSQSTVDAYAAALHSSKFSPCLEQRVKRELAPQLSAGAAIESVTAKITPGPGSFVSPPNVAGSGVATIRISTGGQHGVAYLRFAYITGPLIWVEVDSGTPGAPLPATMWESLIGPVADRADPDMSAEDSGIPIPS